jgi:ribonuclease P protein component
MAPLPRLTRRAEFLKVAAARRKWAAPGLILQAADAPAAASAPLSPWRVGFTASRKVGNAVARNRARRRLRAACAAVLPEHAEGGHDYVLIARAGTLSRDYRALLGDLEEGLRRLGLYRA